MKRLAPFSRLRTGREAPRRRRTAASPGHGGLLDADLLAGAVLAVALHRDDLVRDLHPGGDAPEDRVLRVETAVVRDVDEELAPAAVRAGVRHGDGPSLVVVLAVELVLDLVPGPAAAGARRGPALDHEPRDHPVEDRPVVEAFLHQLPEVPRRHRHRVLEQLDRDLPERRLQRDLRHAPANLPPYESLSAFGRLILIRGIHGPAFM